MEIATTKAGLLRTLWLESFYEVLKLWRLPSFVLPTIAFPIVFYVLFGVVLAPTFHLSAVASRVMIANFGTMAVMATCLFACGVRVAVERGQGWLEAKRASPVPISAYFVAKFVATLTFAVAAIALLLAIGNIFGHGQLQLEQAALLYLILLGGCIPFSALGLTVGYLVEGSAAPAVVNVIMWPMAILSGLWMPLSMLPVFVRHLAPKLPSFQLAGLAVSVVAATDQDPLWQYVLGLIVFTVCCLLVAMWRFRRDSVRPSYHRATVPCVE